MSSSAGPAPQGAYARFVGNGALGTTEFWYWIQALYPGGFSLLSSVCPTGAVCPAAFDQNNFAQVTWNPSPGAIGYRVWRTTTSAAPTEGAELLSILTSETGIKDDGSQTPGTPYTSTVRYDGFHVWQFKYNFGVDGGVTPIIPSVTDTIPANALVLGGTVAATTSVTAAGAATVAVGTTAGSSASALLGATAKASLAAGDVVNSAATFAAPVWMSAAGQLQLTIATGPLTGGVLEGFFFGVVTTGNE